MPDRISSEERYYRQPILDPKEYKRIIYDPGIVTRIILNRPRYLNSLSHALWAELEDAFDRASADEGCHVIVLSGAGSSFSCGDDTFGLTPESAPALWDGDARSPEDLRKQYGSEAELWHQYNIEHDYFITWLPLYKLRTIPKPTIAILHGYCIYMAFSLARSMDILFASEDALLLPAGPGQIWDLGPRKVIELAFEHRFLTAREAYEFHMINRIFPSYEILEKEAMDFAYRVADEPPPALRRSKEAFLDVLDHQGFTAAAEADRTPFHLAWKRMAEQGHRMRYEGKGMARTPVALANLKMKLESEGAEVPEHVLAALARVAARNDKATWQKALHAGWREPARIERADASAKRYEEMKAEAERRKKAEIERRKKA